MIGGISGGGSTGSADDDGGALGGHLGDRCCHGSAAVAGAAVVTADGAGVSDGVADGCEGNWNTSERTWMATMVTGTPARRVSQKLTSGLTTSPVWKTDRFSGATFMAVLVTMSN